MVEAFVKIFDGNQVQLGPLKMQIYEASIAAATKILREGERWFKNNTSTEFEFRAYLKEKYHNMAWQQEIPRSYLKKKWR